MLCVLIFDILSVNYIDIYCMYIFVIKVFFRNVEEEIYLNLVLIVFSIRF